MASKLYDCDVTNISKSSPKMTKKRRVLIFLQISQILSSQFERSFLQWFYAILESFVCDGIKIVYLWSDQQPKVALNDQEMANCELF